MRSPLRCDMMKTKRKTLVRTHKGNGYKQNSANRVGSEIEETTSSRGGQRRDGKTPGTRFRRKLKRGLGGGTQISNSADWIKIISSGLIETS
ncbi:hypothetical protein QE152_g8418 [Popillia japonica]|uniref:Uncharacterized protein n=1 Tax=Popillia japonica TaxID=7064 RepID=A0AAW1M3L6_POPJA